MVKEVLISLDSTMTGRLSMNLIPPIKEYSQECDILFSRWL
jgi:hypothetical protein